MKKVTALSLLLVILISSNAKVSAKDLSEEITIQRGQIIALMTTDRLNHFLPVWGFSGPRFLALYDSERNLINIEVSWGGTPWTKESAKPHMEKAITLLKELRFEYKFRIYSKLSNNQTLIYSDGQYSLKSR